MQTKQDVLKACTISGNIVSLPNVQLDRKLYQDVAKSLELIGGKWTRKVNGFLFSENPTELLAQIATGQKRNLQKEYQFFPTPDQLAAQMVEAADIKATDIILEPSAGQGAIIKAIHKVIPNHPVMWCETMSINQTFLFKLQDKETFLKPNFLHTTHYNFFDKIIANPPFSKNQDIDHICQMYLSLKPGGRIVTIASNHWKYGQEKKCQQFREWLEEIEADISDIEAGQFSESGTNIATCLLIIDKPR